MMLGKALSPFCIPVTETVKIDKCVKFDPNILLDLWLTVKAAPHECVIRTSQPQA